MEAPKGLGMIKAIFGFNLKRGKSMAAYRKSFTAWRAPRILSNTIAPQGLSLMWSVKPAIPPGHPKPVPVPYEGFTMNWFSSGEDFGKYADTPLFKELAEHGLEWLEGAHGYLVDEVVHWRAPQPIKPGELVQGFKLIVYASRKPGMPADAFEKYYREVHAPLARKHHPAMIGYVQNFVRSPLMGDSPTVDVITEMHFHDRTDFKQHFYLDDSSPAIIAADIAQFMDMSSVQCLTVEEIVYRPPV